MYEVEITPEGLRHLNRLPDKIRDSALATIFGPLAENPQRLGKRLVGELFGLRSCRRGDYRIIYELYDDDRIVLLRERYYDQIGRAS